MLFSTLCMVSGCVSALKRAQQAYAEGRLVDAERALERATEKKNADEVTGLRDKIVADRKVVAQVFLDKARMAEKEETVPAPLLALRYYEAAQRMTVDGEGLDAAIVSRIAELSQQQAELERSISESHKVLSSASKTHCDEEQIIEPIQQLNQHRTSIPYTSSSSSKIAQVALDAAKVCFASAEYEATTRLTELAQVLLALPRPISIDSEVRQELARIRSGDGEEEEASPKKQRRRRKRKRPRQNKTPHKDTIEQEIRTRLQSAVELYNAGKTHDALVLVDRDVAKYPAASAQPLKDQQDAWRSARKRLIRDYLRRAEEALRDESTDDAYSFYKRILELDPKHGVARDRLTKLEALKKLRGKGK